MLFSGRGNYRIYNEEILAWLKEQSFEDQVMCWKMMRLLGGPIISLQAFERERQKEVNNLLRLVSLGVFEWEALLLRACCFGATHEEIQAALDAKVERMAA
ncbi:MAG: hypothetical protein HYT50_00445 [Candidatus Wildermuthbacteria bacterium]|nr:hypothetical protein [Candidatus Wildermuthbacteria bacterium]